jgi:hypothetical protein
MYCDFQGCFSWLTAESITGWAPKGLLSAGGRVMWLLWMGSAMVGTYLGIYNDYRTYSVYAIADIVKPSPLFSAVRGFIG